MGLYQGNAANYPVQLTIPADNKERSALSVNIVFEGLADRTEWLKAALNALPDDPNTWTALQTFTKGIVVTNSTTNPGAIITGGPSREGLVVTGGTGDEDAIKAYGTGDGGGGYFTSLGGGVAITAIGGPGGGTAAVIQGGPGAYGLYLTGTGAVAARVLSDDDRAGEFISGSNTEPALYAENTDPGPGGAIEAKSDGNNSTLVVQQDGSGYAAHIKKTASGGVSTMYVENDNATAAIEVNQVAGYSKPAIKVNEGAIVLGGVEPGPTQNLGQDNALIGPLICKAWGTITVTGTGASATFSIDGGINVASATLDGTTGVDVAFARDVIANYTIAYEKTALNSMPYTVNRGASGFLARFAEGQPEANADIRTGTRTLSFQVMARQ